MACSFLKLLSVCAMLICLKSTATATIVDIPPEDIKDYANLIQGLYLAEAKYTLESSAGDSIPFGFVPGTIETSVDVVQGELFRVTATIAPLSCIGSAPSAFCEEYTKTGCNFKVWSRPFLEPERRLLIMDWNCSP